jgi:hypothetical protein
MAANVYKAGTISYLEPAPDWDRVELKHHHGTELLQAMKLESCDPVTVISISSRIAYAVKESKTSQVAAKTGNMSVARIG